MFTPLCHHKFNFNLKITMCGRRDRLLGEGERDWEMGEVQQGAVVILLSIGKWYNDVQDALTFLSTDQLSFHH